MLIRLISSEAVLWPWRKSADAEWPRNPPPPSSQGDSRTAAPHHPLRRSTGVSTPTPAYLLRNTDYLKLLWGFPSRKFSTLCKMGGLGQLRSRWEYLPVSLTEPSPVLFTRYKSQSIYRQICSNILHICLCLLSCQSKDTTFTEKHGE